MSFHYPDFLSAGSPRARQNSLAPNQVLGLDPSRSPGLLGLHSLHPTDSPLAGLALPPRMPLSGNYLNQQAPAFALNQFSFNGYLQDSLLKLQHNHEFTASAGPKVNARTAYDSSSYDPAPFERPAPFEQSAQFNKSAPFNRSAPFDPSLYAHSAPYDPNLAPFNPNFLLDYAYSQNSEPANRLRQNVPSLNPKPQDYSAFGGLYADSFHLPRELQGGIGNISSRRPSYAAELFTRNSPGSPTSKLGTLGSLQKHSLASIAAANNYGLKSKKDFGDLGQLADSLDTLSLNANFSDFQARRPSQLAEYQPQSTQLAANPETKPYAMYSEPFVPKKYPASFEMQSMKLENGLILRDQYILASIELKSLFSLAIRYFQDVELSKTIVGNLHGLLANAAIGKLVQFIKNANNLTFNHKMLCLVINKNGKLDLLSYPSNSNIYLQNDDLVIVDGDRGKDLVMILEPLVQLDMAILFNFLKKIEHLKLLTILDPNLAASSVKNNHLGGVHPTAMDAAKILSSHHLTNEDNEFIISLPTKQVLRFATPKDVQRLSNKFLEEKKAFLTCHNKIKELKLENDLTLINVEYQYDFKKLIFYYFAGFKRIDFRGLIKELFKIYKTRIWLCAVLPFDTPELYTSLGQASKPKNEAKPSASKKVSEGIPPEYQLGNEQVAQFSLESFERIPQPNYFHLKNMANLVRNLMHEVNGHFYGFSASTSPGEPERRNSHSIAPSFDPFGDDRTLA